MSRKETSFIICYLNIDIIKKIIDNWHYVSHIILFTMSNIFARIEIKQIKWYIWHFELPTIDTLANTIAT